MTDIENLSEGHGNDVEGGQLSESSRLSEATVGGADAVPETHHADDAEPGTTKDDERSVL